ncbi:MAG TPA: patatin-like phospholipase family protein [Gemmatimonadales bacterium]
MAARKIGLALAGGGPGGAVYEIGALRALEEALEGVDFTALHTYVGVSAGAVVAASLANGISPAAMARAIVRAEPGEPPLRPEIFFTPFYKEWRRRSLKLPRLFLDVVLRFARHPRDRSLLESLARLGGALPVAVFDNEPIRRFLANTFARKGRTDDFRKLRRELIVVATDLEAGKPIRFGEPGLDRVPISRAVQASTAFPGLYPPVTIDGRECVDGVLLKTMHASVALDHGADVVFCINPIVPIDIAAGASRGLLHHGVLLERGLPAILSQTFRTMIHSRLEVGMAAYRTRYPGTDVLLFEPDSDEYRMFFTNVFKFGSRQSVCERAYEVTRATLRRGYTTFARRLARHGVQLRKDILDDTTRDLWTSVGLGEGQPSPLASDLDRTLRDLADLVEPPA